MRIVPKLTAKASPDHNVRRFDQPLRCSSAGELVAYALGKSGETPHAGRTASWVDLVKAELSETPPPVVRCTVVTARRGLR